MDSYRPTAIVTGAAQGIGYAIADRLLQGGYRVCLVDLKKEKGEESLADLEKRYGSDKLKFAECNVSSEASFQGAFSKALQAFGAIDLLVNNAGIADEYDPPRMVAINLMGTINGSQLALKFMGTSHGGKGGAVINVASVAGLYPVMRCPVYSATKHGIVGLTRSYGNQYHFDRNGVIFMAICPCRVETPLLETAKYLKVTGDARIFKKTIRPDFVAEGVMKLLRDKRNGSTLMAIPGKFLYTDVVDELKNLPR